MKITVALPVIVESSGSIHPFATYESV